MKVFISWSGHKSKETAEALSTWIRQVIQAAETWISLDIEKGARWNDKINKELEQSKVGIICLNKENLSSEWILFEAGALSKTQDAHVCTFLLDISPSEVKPPLGQFQHTTFSKEDIMKLTHTINSKIILGGEKTIPEKDLDEVFEVFWPRLESKLLALANTTSPISPILRSDRDILEEILQAVRSLNKQDDFSKYLILFDFLDDKSKYSNDSFKILKKYINYKDNDLINSSKIDRELFINYLLNSSCKYFKDIKGNHDDNSNKKDLDDPEQNMEFTA